MTNSGMKATNMILWSGISLLIIFSFFSSLLITFSEKNLVWDLTSSGFSFFLELYSFPIQLISAALAIFSIWAVVYNIYRTRLVFLQGQLVTDLYRCEDELQTIQSQKVTPQEVIAMLQSKLAHRSNIGDVCGYFSRISNSEISIEQVIPHLTKFGICEADGIFCTKTQNLTLRLTRYSLALLELNNISEDKMFVRYYANKYIALMIDLYHYKSEINISLIRLCFQLASVKLKFDFSKANASEYIEMDNKLQQLIKEQKL